MAVWLVLWQLVLASICPCTAKPLSDTNEETLPSVEASGNSGTEVTSMEVSSSTTKMLTDVDTTHVVFTSSPVVNYSKPALIGTVIMEFISQYVVFIIIAGVVLVVLFIIVCTVLFMKRSKASAYYPSSYPTKKYVDEQDKTGSSKNFDEVNDEPKEDTVNSSEQLQADILSATHNLKKKVPSKEEEKQEVSAAGKGEYSQAADKEGRNSAAPEAGTKEEGPISDTTENNKAPEKEEGKEIPSEQEEKNGGGKGAGNENRENEEEGKDNRELETGAVQGTSSKESPANDIRRKSQQTAGKPQIDTDADQSQALDKGDGAEGQKPKEVKFAQQDLSEASSVAEPCDDHSKDQEDTPLISKPNGAPNDIRAF